MHKQVGNKYITQFFVPNHNWQKIVQTICSDLLNEPTLHTAKRKVLQQLLLLQPQVDPI